MAPWSPQRARRVRIMALVLVVVGPLFGTVFALVLVPADPGDVVPADEARPAELVISGTIRAIDAGAGEMAVRLVLSDPDPSGDAEGDDLFGPGGVLTDDVALGTNDATGQNLRMLAAGQPPGSLTVTVDLSDSRVTRYPVDRYRATVLLFARRGGADGDPIPVRFSLRSSDPLFTTEVRNDLTDGETVNLDLRVQRRWTVIGWAAFFVLVCWLLAISAASLAWTTVVHGIAQPGWALGFLIGVLFALPPLRAALPGNPQAGSLVDFAAFYWAVGIVALTLVAMVGSWNMRVRRSPQSPDAPPAAHPDRG